MELKKIYLERILVKDIEVGQTVYHFNEKLTKTDEIIENKHIFTFKDGKKRFLESEYLFKNMNFETIKLSELKKGEIFGDFKTLDSFLDVYIKINLYDYDLCATNLRTGEIEYFYYDHDFIKLSGTDIYNDIFKI